MKIVVLGAGVIGVTTAYILAKKGHDVTLIDRNENVAAECSFANGGQLSYSHVEPWAHPSVLPKIPKWLIDRNSPLVFRPTLDVKTWAFAFAFLRNCTQIKSDATTKIMMPLALYSRSVLQEIITETNIDFSYQNNGIIHIFSDQKSLEQNMVQANLQQELGCHFELLKDKDACIAKEPALAYCPSDIKSGIYFPLDASGDANKFTSELLKICQRLGVKTYLNHNIEKLNIHKNTIKSVICDKGEFSGDKFILSLGAYSGQLLKSCGINLPIYPLKGYSLSIDIKDDKFTPKFSLTDQKYKIVCSNFGKIIRVAGTAEFGGFNHNIDEKRIASLKLMTKKLLSTNIGDIDNAKPWACLRPSTPDGAPLLGSIKKFDNLLLNTGHGTLGWTLAAGSAYAIASYIDGKELPFNFADFSVSRYNNNI